MYQDCGNYTVIGLYNKTLIIKDFCNGRRCSSHFLFMFLELAIKMNKKEQDIIGPKSYYRQSSLVCRLYQYFKCKKNHNKAALSTKQNAPYFQRKSSS